MTDLTLSNSPSDADRNADNADDADDRDDAPDSDRPTGDPISLERYAFVVAALSEGYTLIDVLDREGLSEDEWEASEEHWVDALSESADTDLALNDRFDSALAAGRAQFARAIPPIDAEVQAFLTFQQHMTAAPAPLPFLAKHGLFFGDWVRLQERWAERFSADSNVRTQAAAFLTQTQAGDLPEVKPAPRVWPHTMQNKAAKSPVVNVVVESDAATEPITWGLSELRDPVHQEDPNPHAEPTLPSQVKSAQPKPQGTQSSDSPSAATFQQPSFMRTPAAPPPAPMAAAPNLPTSSAPMAAPNAPNLPTAPSPTPTLSPALNVTGTFDLNQVLKRPLPFAKTPESTPAKPATSAQPSPSIAVTADLPTDLIRKIAAGALPFPASKPNPAPPSPSAPGAATPIPGKPPAPSPPSVSTEITLEEPSPITKDAARGLPNAAAAKAALPFQPARTNPTSPNKPTSLPSEPRITRPQRADPPEETLDDSTLEAQPSPIKPVVPFQRSKPAAPPVPAPPPATPQGKPAPAARPVGLPQLTLEQYASMCAELAVFHDRAAAVFQKYGLTDPHIRAAVDAAWKDRLRRYPSEQAEWERRYWQYENAWRRNRK
ncbi:MAG: hypothetical protein IPK82_44245 [Polyangiaceae bacterium]|nr:hypothetical protein [Polyangiaceae bacterium]